VKKTHTLTVVRNGKSKSIDTGEKTAVKAAEIAWKDGATSIVVVKDK
jgi:hypothetical protein